MQLSIVLGLSMLSALGAAENTVEGDDVPGACLATCQSTIDLTARCDDSADDDDDYRRCVCLAQDAQLHMNQCAVCVQQNGMRDPDDNDVADLMDDCGWDFTQASASAGATTASPTVIVSTSTGQSTTAIATITQTPSAATQTSAQTTNSE
ncbi:hypothetical protein SLS62_003814 [Diatrype stigma]|uniref:Uncharacterized protein n=1 Tax=Diatrype stigma TaxID=117547 RepID=A0AAN9UW03_9PEZI